MKTYMQPKLEIEDRLTFESMICESVVNIGDETYKGDDSGIGVKEQDFNDDDLYSIFLNWD